MERVITKSFKRLLDKGIHRGFITYEELGKSLGKRNSTNENVERSFIILLDEKITLVEKKSQYQTNKKKDASNQTELDMDGLYGLEERLLQSALSAVDDHVPLQELPSRKLHITYTYGADSDDDY